MALAQGDFERAGREFGEIGEEGGLGEWEGQVNVIELGDWARSQQGHLDLGSGSDHCTLHLGDGIARPHPTDST